MLFDFKKKLFNKE